MSKSNWRLTGHAVLLDGTEVSFPSAEFRDRLGCWHLIEEMGNQGFTVGNLPDGLSGTFIPGHRIKELIYDVSRAEEE